MSDGTRLLLTLALAAALPLLTVPVAIRVAARTGFLDSPRGYKAHLKPTPYLGGAAVFVAALTATLVFGGGELERYWPLLAGAAVLCLTGTIDDRVNLSPLLRVVIEVLVAYLLWAEGLGWSFLESDSANLLLTAFWIVGVVNAFNLMDNMDGACASVALPAAACIAALAVLGDDVALAVIATALCGALAGFLRFNLAKPSRIFLGDGGSMAIGFLVSAALMSTPMGELSGAQALLAAAMIVALPIFDTTLVVLSRRRRQVPILSGATDHTTHRLLGSLGSPQRVCAVLAVAQAFIGGLAIEATRLGDTALVVLTCGALLGAAATLAILEGYGWTPVSDDS